MIEKLNIEQPDELLHYLQRAGHLEAIEVPVITVLRGGVSNRTVLVERAHGNAFVLKQALAKLRVAVDWFSNPQRIHREALGLIWLARLAPAGTTTPLLFEDETHHLLAMQAVPRPHENWKTRLLAGGLEMEHVRQFGHLLGTIHARARERRGEVAPVFADRTYFETLRLEPYYRFTAMRVPAAANFFGQLIADTERTRETLVHGDYSPKNILVHQHRLILLDHEVIHFGDPAFDLGFSLTHFLSKANHLPALGERLLAAARHYWTTYAATAGEIALAPGFAARAVRHTLACLLARVEGRSPLEYLSQTERDRQRQLVLAMLEKLPLTLPEFFDRWQAASRNFA